MQLSIGSSGLFILYLASGGCAAVAACACRRCKRQRQLQGVRGALGSHVALAAAHMLLHGWTGWRFEAQTCGYGRTALRRGTSVYQWSHCIALYISRVCGVGLSDACVAGNMQLLSLQTWSCWSRYIAAFLLPAAMTMVQQHDGSEIVAQATVGGLVGAALVQRVS